MSNPPANTSMALVDSLDPINEYFIHVPNHLSHDKGHTEITLRSFFSFITRELHITTHHLLTVKEEEEEEEEKEEEDKNKERTQNREEWKRGMC